MAESGDSGGLTKLLVAGGLGYLLYQYAQSQGLVGPGAGGPCPANTVQARLPDGSVQCVPLSSIQSGNVSTGQAITIAGMVISVLTPGLGILAAWLTHLATTGSSATSVVATAAPIVTNTSTVIADTTTVAADAGTTTADAGAATTDAATAADVLEASWGISLDAAGGIAFGVLAIALTIWDQVSNAIGQRANQQLKIGKGGGGCPRVDGGDTYTGGILDSEQVAMQSFVSALVSALNAQVGPTGSYPDLNKQQAVQAKAVGGFARFSGFSGSRRRGGFGRFGAVVARSASGGGPVISAAVAAKAAAQAAPAANLATPYGFTNGYYDQGCTSSAYYYPTAVDSRLPVAMLRDYRGLVRWIYWTQQRAYNAAVRSYIAYRLKNEGSLPGTSVTSPDQMTYDPAAFDAAVAAFYGQLPVTLFPPAAYQTFHTYPEVNAVALEYMQNLNTARAASGLATVSFDSFSAQVAFVGISGAVTDAAGIGFGGIFATWPGDEVFTTMIKAACGLDALGWGYQQLAVTDPSYGPNPQLLWLIQDPKTGWYIDVIGSRNRGKPQCYKFVAGGTDPLHLVPDQYVPLSGFAGRVGSRRKRHAFGRPGRLVPLERLRS